MDIWNQLLQGFMTAGTPVNLLWAFVGCALGTAVGVLPGIGPATAVAMLLPITTQVEATASMIFFAGIYYGAMYGGSTTSILLNTPGETGTMVTALEGFKMAKNGRAGAALATSAIGSFVAGTIATVLVTLFAPVLAEFAVKLGPPEYFCLMGHKDRDKLGVAEPPGDGPIQAALAGSGALFVDIFGESNHLYQAYLDEAILLSLAGCLAIVLLTATLASQGMVPPGVALITAHGLPSQALWP